MHLTSPKMHLTEKLLRKVFRFCYDTDTDERRVVYGYSKCKGTD